MKTYKIVFYGPYEEVEHCVRLMDEIFRGWYNVHGGHRNGSGKDENGEYRVEMSYTAGWNQTGIWADWQDLKKIFFRLAGRVDPDDLVGMKAD